LIKFRESRSEVQRISPENSNGDALRVAVIVTLLILTKQEMSWFYGNRLVIIMTSLLYLILGRLILSLLSEHFFVFKIEDKLSVILYVYHVSHVS